MLQNIQLQDLVTSFRPQAFALVLVLLAPPVLPGQSQPGDAAVRGTILTEQDQPVGLAIVELRVRSDSAPRRTTRSSETGRFELDGVPAGVYHLFIRGIGFAPGVTSDFTVVAGQVRDLGRIRLQMIAVQLDPIEVTVERPDVVVSADRTGYLTEALTNAAGGVITDVLREIPDVMVDIDGTIRYRGATPAIFVNGRPAPMQGVSLAVFLEQFPADRIDRIEVLDHPPARYASEGSGSVINIVLKQGVGLGMNGSASLSAGTRNQYTASARVTNQRGKLLVNAGLNARWSDSRNADLTLRQNLLADPVTFLQQDARSNRSNQNGGGNVELRYNLSPGSRLFGSLFGYLNWSDRDGSTLTTHLDEARAPTLAYDRLARQHGTGFSADARAGYARVWQEDRHELEVELSAQLNTNRNRSREEIAADSVFQDHELLPAWLTRREDGTRTNGANLQVGYDRPWGKQGQIETGVSARASRQRDDQSTELFEDPETATPELLDDRLIRREQRIGAAFLTMNRRVGKLGLNLGLRGEWFGEEIRLPEGGLIDRGETNLYPSINLNWSPRQRMQVRMGYSQRVNRPGVSVLDPTNRSTDPLNRVVGNPDLESSLSRNVTLGFSWGGKKGQLNVGPYWNRTSNGWERVTTVDAQGISTSTWQNLTARTSAGASLNYAMPAWKGWNGRVHMSLSRTTLLGSLVSQGLEEGKLRWSVGGNLGGPVVRGLVMQSSFGYEPGRDLPQGRTTGQWRADFGFRYRMMNNRTTIGLSLQDPFELRKTSQQIRDLSVIQTGSSRVTTRSASINVSYAFGGARGRPADR